MRKRKINPIMRKNGKLMFDFEVTFVIGLEELAYAVYHQMQIFGKPLPLLRRDCLKYLQDDLSQGNAINESWQDDLDEDLYNQIKDSISRLFPEFEQERKLECDNLK